MPVTPLQAEVTKTAVFDGAGLAITSLTKPFEVVVVVDALTAGSVAIFQLQSTADNFSSDIRVEKTINFVGPHSTAAPDGRSYHHYDMPGIRAGVASAKLRLSLTYIDAASSVSYSAAIKN